MATHKSETAPWRSAHQPRHAKTTEAATAGRGVRSAQHGAWRLPTERMIRVVATEAVLARNAARPDDLLDDVAGLTFELARAADTLRRSVVEREARAEFDRLAERAPVRSLDLLRRNAS